MPRQVVIRIHSQWTRITRISSSQLVKRLTSIHGQGRAFMRPLIWRQRVPPIGPPTITKPLMGNSDTTPASRPRTGDCQTSKSDNVPNVTLRTGDLVILGNGELIRLDSQMRPTTIASDGFLTEARGVVVDRNGQIFITALACTERKGAVVRVDPLTGTQTPVVTVFKRPMGLVFDSDGQLLVGDEIAQRGVWGRLYRVNLKHHTAEVIAEFPPPNGVHSIAIYPGSFED